MASIFKLAGTSLNNNVVKNHHFLAQKIPPPLSVYEPALSAKAELRVLNNVLNIVVTPIKFLLGVVI